MKLTDAHIEDFYRLFLPTDSEEQIASLSNAYRERLRADTSSLNSRFLYPGPTTFSAASEIATLQSGVYGLTVKTKDGRAADFLESLLKDATEYVREAKAQKLFYRIILGNDHDKISEVATRFGFRKLSERVEYRSPLIDLPGEDGSPLEWRAMADKSETSLRAHAELLEKSGQGDPDWSPDDDAYELLKSYLSDSVLIGDARCVQVAYQNSKPAAVVVAQVNPRTGWSRITYMGILPEFRGKGLGRWVHRHGFTMMREQGGKTYHGGTLVKNAPMRKLFEAHGCVEFQRMEEWVLELGK